MTWGTSIIYASTSSTEAFLSAVVQYGIGVIVTYYALTGWFNRTHIMVSPELIGVRHRPLPWRGNINVEVPDLRQFYSKKKAHAKTTGVYFTYEVWAVTNRDRNIRIVRGLHTQEQATYIEQQMGKYLGIQDVLKPGKITEGRV